MLNHRFPPYNPDPRGAVSAEIRAAYELGIMKGRPTKGIILSPSSHFDSKIKQFLVCLVVFEGRQRPKQVTGRDMAQTGATYLPVRIFTWLLSVATPRLGPQTLV